MSYRVEIKVVIYAETRQVAESFAATVETYIGETFTPETAVYTARIEQPLDADGKAQRTSPADLVGALQDVVHTDPGPVRAGKAHRDASSDVHTQMHKCEHCGALTKIDCVSDFQLIQYICGTCGKETRAHEVFEAHEKRT